MAQASLPLHRRLPLQEGEPLGLIEVVEQLWLIGTGRALSPISADTLFTVASPARRRRAANRGRPGWR